MTEPLNADGSAPPEDNDPFGLNLPTKAAVPQAPEAIKADDPLGRQPGDPNETIELPLGVLGAPPKLGLNFGSSDRPMTLDEMDAAHADALKDVQPLERRPDVVTDNVRQEPDLSEKTQLEMAAGRHARAEASAGNFTPAPAAPEFVAPAANRASGAAFAAPQNNDVARSYAQPPTITSATLAEQEAGRAAVARKSTDVAHGQDVMRRAAAKRLAEGAPADAGDLSYVVPRG